MLTTLREIIFLEDEGARQERYFPEIARYLIDRTDCDLSKMIQGSPTGALAKFLIG
jgi:hypothetical protein